MRIKFLFLISILFSKPLLAVPESFADLVEQLSPAVVSIASTTIVENNNQNQIPQFPEGSPFDDFFKEYFDRDQRRSQRPMTGLGSGFIISEDGIVVTNNHVIEGADEITVILNDETEFTAELLGRDPKADIAVLKIDPKNKKLTYVGWGDSDKMRVGDWSIAIGNPLGLGGTVTAGIISAISRDLGSGPYVKFLQTDASINRGNSGGPLFNLDGEVIGINTAIVSQTGGSIGLGFAIPANSAKKIVQQLKDFGKTKRGWLGVQIQDLTPEFSESLGYDSTEGAFVASVNPESPAAKSNIQAGDIIVEFDGKKISSFKDLPKVVAETPIGNEVVVSIWRNGGLIDINVKIDELNEGGIVTANSDGLYIKELDITLVQLDQTTAETLGIDPSTSGILVKTVGENNKNLMVNDVIIQVSSEKITDLPSFEKMLSDSLKLKRDKLLLRVIREGNEFWLINPLVIE